ncbi:hypothetical protein L6452_13126 [Arctium lappa]|uniref:Uncharacterized protein n=1 Tax=Arctium lappa TaxID=4217 RepID=A0ACB9CHF7_ARCLA|nr:hypothetical protein L6452_13126 [Arctium lappa]
MESNGYEHQAEESSVKKECNNEEFDNGDDKSKSGQCSNDIYRKLRDELIDDPHATMDYSISFIDHDLVKLKRYVDIIIDLHSEVKAELYDELRRNNEDLMKSERFGEREVDLRNERPIPIQCVQMEPNENGMLEEESSKKEGQDCNDCDCYSTNSKRRNALIHEAHAHVNECVRLLQHDMVKLKRYILEIVYLKSDVKADYYDELRHLIV